jgi:hypothetical protein
MISQNSEKGIREASIQVGIEAFVFLVGIGLIVWHFVRRKRN